MFRLVRLSLCSGALLFGGHVTSRAGEPETGAPWREMWAGAEVGPNAWSAYSGQTYALFGTIDENGARLRAVTGYGRYRYRTTHWDGTQNAASTHQGTVAFADILLGYHWQTGPLTIKVFAGASGDNHTITPFDPQNDTQGLALGARLVLESWLNIGDTGWSALDLSWGSAHEMSTSRLRLGLRVLPGLSLGLEGGHVDTSSLLTLRGGLFVRGEWASGEASLSGGIADDDSAGRPSAYGTVNVLWRF